MHHFLKDGLLTADLLSRPSLKIRARAEAVAKIAGADAEEVDRDAAYPTAAVAAMRQEKLLALIVPIEFGGEGALLSDVADVCFTLGQACASTAMILAMHYAALACIVRHGQESLWHRMLLCRVANEGLLLASSTTEGAAGGNVRSSVAPLLHDRGMVFLERAATVMSYGAQADGIVTTARRDVDGAGSDQSLVVFLKKDYDLRPTASWQTLGMRGTCSAGFVLKAAAPREQMLPVGYDKIHPISMVPVSHLLWSSAWLGIATAAVVKAQTFVRSSARRAGGQMPPGAGQYTIAVSSLRGLRSRLRVALADYAATAEDVTQLCSLENQAALNLLKVEMSDGALATVMLAMRTCGLAGYRLDGDFAMGRHLRDILSAPIMVHNDRILGNAASAALLSPVPSSLKDP